MRDSRACSDTKSGCNYPFHASKQRSFSMKLRQAVVRKMDGFSHFLALLRLPARDSVIVWPVKKNDVKGCQVHSAMSFFYSAVKARTIFTTKLLAQLLPSLECSSNARTS